MIDSRLCFVAMPFAPSLKNVYDAVEGAVKDYCALKCVRADRIERSERVTDDIRNNIKNARLVIADLTGINPNVFYEVGMAHGVRMSQGREKSGNPNGSGREQGSVRS